MILKEKGGQSAPVASGVHQTLMEKSEVGLAETVTAKVSGLLSLPKTSLALVCLLITRAPRSSSACLEAGRSQILLLGCKCCFFIGEEPLCEQYTELIIDAMKIAY